MIRSAPIDGPQESISNLSSPQEDVDLSIIIVNYNVREFLEQALRSIYQAISDLTVEVFVVDNNSIDGSVEMVHQRFPGVHLIANEHNVGFSKANNQAIERAKGRNLFILNPDTIIQEDTLTTLVKFMDDHPKAGAVGCKILNPDGTFAPESRRSFPTPMVAFYRMTGLSHLFPKSPRFGRYNLSYLSPEEESEVDALSGSCMVVRKKAISEAGMFDEDFFMYGEDLDWCYRIQQAGWTINYTPATQIIHYKGESTKKGELRYVLLFYGAMLRFAEKHFKKKHSIFFRVFLRLGIVARGSLQALINGIKRYAFPITESMLLISIVSIVGISRYALADLTLPTLFIPVIVPIYVLCTLMGIAAAGGYRRQQLHRIQSVLIGTLFSLGILATLSFFIKSIAFSRLIVLASFLFSLFVLSTHRLVRGHRKRSKSLQNFAILIGDGTEAERFVNTLSRLPHPPLDLIGYVSLTSCPPEPGSTSSCLGTLRHLRDIVRLRAVNSVVFASRSVPNRVAFDVMQQLKDLPVHFKMLGEDHEHLIGQASVEALTSLSLIDAETALGTSRSTLARRAFEVPLAISGIILYPILLVIAKLTGPHSGPSVLANKITRFPAILAGKKALVGYSEEEQHLIAPSWRLKPGVFTVTESLPASSREAHQISQAYWLYVRNQSIAFDFDIMLRALRHRHN